MLEKPKNVLCLILARGGSKRVPGKNIKPLGGKPLLAYTIECAKKSKYITRIIVSTDDEKIASVSRSYGAEAPFLRPAEISQDGSKELDAFKHALSWLKTHEKYEPDLIVKLFPTSPFRKPESVDKAVELMLANPSADSVRSVILCSEHPYKMWTIASNRLKSLIPLDQKPKDAHTFSYQILPTVYIQNASIDITKPSNIWVKDSITGEEIVPFIMDADESVDINHPIDFQLAEMVIENNASANAGAPLIPEDLEAFARYMDYKVDRCIVCGGSKISSWAKYGSFTAVQCDACKMIWINPMVNKEGTTKYYQDYIGMRFEDKDKTEKRKIQYKIDKGFIQNYVTAGRVLDVGCSGGFFLEELGDSYERHGAEIDGKAVEYARDHYSFGKNVLQKDLLDLTFPNGHFDLVVMRGVIEHLHDPESAIKKVSQLLRKGGYYYIAATPNTASFSAVFYRERWNQFHPIRHIYYFSTDTLPKLCSRYGLKMVSFRLPYLETPYANVEKDINRVSADIRLERDGTPIKNRQSPAFWENMMNMILIRT
jgi:CMP-N-acetylneuraminic acid synthetase/2-polyprenyl-3-methyl-5-hydroxy-6-metoxy-1,4-benzoquinol methylase